MTEAPKKILCIEDDRETAKLIAEELSWRGFYPLIAYDGRVGLAAIQKKIPDLVLCDVGLPDVSGFEVLKRWKEASRPFSPIPFIFLTGFCDRHDELQGRSLGADDYVTKPIDFDILEAVIRARLIGGVVRHELFAKLAKPNDRRVAASSRAVGDKPSSKATARQQLVELIDSPTVDFHLDNARPASGSTTETEAAVRTVTDRFIKP
jgi:DNA-binding response OmpR family regulator